MDRQSASNMAFSRPSAWESHRGLCEEEVAAGDDVQITRPLHTQAYMRCWKGWEGSGYRDDMQIMLDGRIFFPPWSRPAFPPLLMALSYIRVKDPQPHGNKIVAMGITLWRNQEIHSPSASRFIVIVPNCRFLDRSKFEFGRTRFFHEDYIRQTISGMVTMNGITPAGVEWDTADSELDLLCSGTTPITPTANSGGSFNRCDFWSLVMKSRPTDIKPEVLRSMSIEDVLTKVTIPHRVIHGTNIMQVQTILGGFLRQPTQITWYESAQVVDWSFRENTSAGKSEEERLRLLRVRDAKVHEARVREAKEREARWREARAREAREKEAMKQALNEAKKAKARENRLSLQQQRAGM